jgi:hypothetical protein
MGKKPHRDVSSHTRRVDTAHRGFLLANILLFICFRDPEPQILDYRTQQYKLFPYLAASFAGRFAAIRLWNMYQDIVSELAGGDLERLPEVKCFICLCAYCIEINLLNAQLNPICHLLPLGAHPILHISRIRIKIHLLMLTLLWVFPQYCSGVRC